ncbi:MAG: hypothetical protein C4560_12615 [Nitrospiraceae bacterium]|nr:MAG: hypothetical protein C4560_12615 [Nitrospiraceae bacterium]
MHWFEIAIGFIFGGVIGVIAMAALAVSGREEEKMDKYASLIDSELSAGIAGQGKETSARKETELQ